MGLCTNRAAAHLQTLRREREKQKFQIGEPLPAVLRPLAMRANVDASRAADLDPENAKALLRKGQALMWMSSMQQRAKEAARVLKMAHASPNLPAVMKKEAEQWLKLANKQFMDQTDTPEQCR